MIKTYELAANLDIMGTPRVTASKGRFSTSDRRIQMILRAYPGVTLVSERPDEPIGPGNSFPPVQGVVVTNGGLQLKEQKPR